MSEQNEPEQLGMDPSPRGSWGMTWFGFFGAAFAWLVHLLIAALVAEWGCIGGWGEIAWGGVTIVSLIIIGITVAMTILAVVSTWVARRSLRQFSPPGQSEGSHVSKLSSGPSIGLNTELSSELSTKLFLARTGYRAGLLFIVIILAESLPILFYLAEC